MIWAAVFGVPGLLWAVLGAVGLALSLAAFLFLASLILGVLRSER